MVPDKHMPILQGCHQESVSVESHASDWVCVGTKLFHSVDGVTAFSNLIDGDILLASSHCHNLLVFVELDALDSSFLFRAQDDFDTCEISNYQVLSHWTCRYNAISLI